MSAAEYRTTRIVEATAEEVFNAWVDPEVLSRWWGPGDMTAEVELDPRPGGAYRFVMTDPEPGSRSVVVLGTYRTVEPPRRLQFTWRWESGSPDAVESLVTVELEPLGDRTELTLIHGGFPDETVAAPYRSGWDRTLPGLEALLARR
jgi:uncharacterized protein YndB with AHSA1/START domain